MFNNEITLTAATQWSAATPVCTFLEDQSITLLPPNLAPRLLFYSYRTIGVATGLNLVLAPAVALAANFSIQLEIITDARTFITVNFGRTGLIVPRVFGLVNSISQAPDTAVGSPNNAVPYVMLLNTNLKDDVGTFRVGWDYVNIGGGGL